MTQIKEEVIQMIEELPDDAGIADIMAELYFRQKVNEGLKELDEGKEVVWSPRAMADLAADLNSGNCCFRTTESSTAISPGRLGLWRSFTRPDDCQT